MKKELLLMAATAMLLTACVGQKSTAIETTTAAIETTTAPTTEPTTAAVESVVGETVEYYSQDVNITNGTGVGIVELYISSSDSDDWGSDLLDGKSFAADETLLFAPDVVGTAEDTWDIMVLDEDGDEITFKGINLSSATALKLHWGADGATPTVSITKSGEEQYYSQDLDITNGTGVTIVELYISLSEEDNWGEDMLGQGTFLADETKHFSTELVGTADTNWDIKIVDEDGDEVVFEEINFSSAKELNLNWGADGATPTVSIK